MLINQGRQLNDFFEAQNVKNRGFHGYVESSSDRRFLATIEQRPEPLPMSGKKILDTKVAEILASVPKIRYITLRKLKFCSILNGTVVDSLTVINDYGKSILAENPTVEQFGNLIDSNAKIAYDFILDAYYDVDKDVRILIRKQRNWRAF